MAGDGVRRSLAVVGRSLASTLGELGSRWRIWLGQQRGPLAAVLETDRGRASIAARKCTCQALYESSVATDRFPQN